MDHGGRGIHEVGEGRDGVSYKSLETGLEGEVDEDFEAMLFGTYCIGGRGGDEMRWKEEEEKDFSKPGS